MGVKTKETDKKLTLDDSDFWAEIERQFMMCYKVTDKFGHIEKCQFSISKSERKMMNLLRAQCPEDWFKSQAEFYRSIMKVGRIVLMKWLERGGAENITDPDIRTYYYDVFTAISQEESKQLIEDAVNWAHRVLGIAKKKDPINIKRVQRLEKAKKQAKELSKKYKSAWADEGDE